MAVWVERLSVPHKVSGPAAAAAAAGLILENDWLISDLGRQSYSFHG